MYALSLFLSLYFLWFERTNNLGSVSLKKFPLLCVQVSILAEPRFLNTQLKRENLNKIMALVVEASSKNVRFDRDLTV